LRKPLRREIYGQLATRQPLIWPFMSTSSFGCLIFDSLIAIWFLAGAPAYALTPSRSY
jgi:hypothetical protein